MRTPAAIAVAVLAAIAAALLAPDRAQPRTSCASEYSHVGVVGGAAARGVGARITALARPTLRWGHVAAWVGVGGVGAGPNGSNAWIQVGLSGYSAGTTNVYYEVAQPGRPPRYVEIATDVPLGSTRDLAVREEGSRAGWWRVWVDGRAVSRALRLPGSHAAWQPMAVAESWNGGKGVCNGFHFRFDAVRTAAAGDGWRALAPATTLSAPGYSLVRRGPASWIARAR